MLNLEYEQSRSPIEQPYKPIFSEIEAGNYSPALAYSHFRGRVDQMRFDPRFYLSMAISGAGFGRDASISRSAAFSKNADFASEMVVNLISSISGSDPADFINPSELGKVREWGQADYLTFWFHVITGLDPDEALILEDNLGLDEIRSRVGFTDSSLPIERRWEDYAFLTKKYVDKIKSLNLGKGENSKSLPNNIQAIFVILDPQVSLGVNAERYLGYLLGIGEYFASISKPTPKLKSQRRQLRSLGADPTSLRDNQHEISGRVNDDNYWKMIANGFRFRQSRVLEAMWDKEKKVKRYKSVPARLSSAELEAEYYAAKA